MSARAPQATRTARAARKPHAITAETIRRCFQKAAGGRRLLLPEPEVCEWVAESVSEQAARLGTIVGRTVLGEAEGHAKRFLTHLPTARGAIRSLYVGCQHLGAEPKDNQHLDALVRIDRLEKDVRALLDRYASRTRAYKWHDLANWIALCAEHAWDDGAVGPITAYTKDDGAQEPRRRRGPTSVNPDDPLCIFVHLVLEELGERRSIHTVSAALLGRRGPRSRDGQKSGARMSSK
jgi:hypothetical protein